MSATHGHVLALHFRKGSLEKVGPFDRCCLLSHRDLTADQKQSCSKDRPRQNGSPHSGSPFALGAAEGSLTSLGCEHSYTKSVPGQSRRFGRTTATSGLLR